MAFCGNCGNEIPEGMKFCPNCGTAVGAVNNGATNNVENSVYQSRPAPASGSVGVMSEKSRSMPANGIDKYGKFYGIGLLVLAIICFYSDPPLVTILLAGAIIAGAVFCFKKKYKLKAFTIIATIMAVYCLSCGISQARDIGLMKIPTASDYAEARAAKQAKKTADSETDIETDANADTSTPDNSKRNTVPKPADTDKQEDKTDIISTGGVNPDLKAFLDSYEEFIDEYIEIMQKYTANPTDLSILGEYTEMMNKYADFEEKINNYDDKEMSAADAAYYLEVTTRVTQKLLTIYSNYGGN